MADIQILPTEFRSGDEIIRGDFVIPKTDGPFPGICKFHGFPGRDNQVHGIASSLAGAGFVVLTFDFREFRHSSGLFSLTGEIEDAKATINHLLESNFVIVSWVGVYGASYSGTIAVCTAARDNRIDAVCLRAPVYDTLWFAKLPMLDSELPRIGEQNPSTVHELDNPEIREQIMDDMVRDAKAYNPKHETEELFPRPLLIITSAADSLISPDGVKSLYQQARQPKSLGIVKDADHGLSSREAYTETLNHVINWFRNTCPVL